MINRTFLLTSIVLSMAMNSYAATTTTPQPTTCITSAFSKTGDPNWYKIALKLTNNCGTDLDFQNTTVKFNGKNNLSGLEFWGDFPPLQYPDNALKIASQLISPGNYLSSLYFHIPEKSWANHILHDGESITLRYGANSATYDPASVKVYLGGVIPNAGEINFISSTKPQNLVQNYALVNVLLNGTVVSQVQLPWNSQTLLSNLTPATYTISPVTIVENSNSFQGSAVPSSVEVKTAEKTNTSISYTQIIKFGSIKIETAAKPTALIRYTLSPVVTLTRTTPISSANYTVGWNATTTIDKLDNGISYQLSTPNIEFEGAKCKGTFVPDILQSKDTAPLTAKLTYTCTQTVSNNIAVNVQGVPTSVSTVGVTFNTTDGSAPVTTNISIDAGKGTGTVNLFDGMTYNVSSTPISGYSASYSLQPFTSVPGGSETITYSVSQGKKVIAGFIPGWKTPPSATSLATAGYTHAFVAFGVFSTVTPGQIVPAFDTITKDYIDQLHLAGIKVLLSLGGASSSINNTSVDFHYALSRAASPLAFQNTFIQSLKQLITQYGFDGFDIDIEHGLVGSGPFAAPTGDIAVMANIINTMHRDLPNLLITLTPQVANISATGGFDSLWGNYAALAMQTHDALSWVGVQIYNTGCAYGIDHVCYADNANSPDLSVAMATALLENWPPKDPSGRDSGFQPYISYLDSNQIVLGYPAPNRQGFSDGQPVKSTAIIKRALQCLKTGVKGPTSCDTYVPPRVYSNIAGVFEWEVTYDQDNNFKFATDLKPCVIDGNCL